MSLQSYKALITVLVESMQADLIEVTPYTISLSYSGRYMYSKTCLGVTLSESDMHSWRYEIANQLENEINNSDDKEAVKLFKKLRTALKKPGRDNMGRSIIDYFKTITVPNEYHLELKQHIGELTSG